MSDNRMVYEFLYRGPTPQNNMQGAWHVVIGEYVQSFGEEKLQTRGPMSLRDAELLGFSMQDILSQITAQALKQADALRTQLEVRNAE